MINRLKNTKCYLSGAMDRVKDRGVAWRKDLTPFLKSKNILVFDPCNKPLAKSKEDDEFKYLKLQLKANKDFDGLKREMKSVRRVDLRMVDEAGFLIINLDLDVHPCGTYEELFLANRQRKPIIIRCEQGKTAVPDWLYGTLPHELFFDTWTQVKDYITSIDSDEVVNDIDGRWVFWDFGV